MLNKQAFMKPVFSHVRIIIFKICQNYIQSCYCNGRLSFLENSFQSCCRACPDLFGNKFPLVCSIATVYGASENDSTYSWCFLSIIYIIKDIFLFPTVFLSFISLPFGFQWFIRPINNELHIKWCLALLVLLMHKNIFQKIHEKDLKCAFLVFSNQALE